MGDIEKGNFEREIIHPENIRELGKVDYKSENLELNHIPVTAPNGENIIEEVNFILEQGDHCFVDGPNGSGKTSIFRIMSELWPTYGGSINFPGKDQIFFIPQTAYLPPGNLRDQIIYPDSKFDMLKKKKKDSDIKELLALVELTELIDKWGLDNTKPWHDIFSGG